MKGFTQRSKSFGFKTSADGAFKGGEMASAKARPSQMVRPHFRAKPAFAEGGPVASTIGDQGNATVQRSKPITATDASEAGGKGPLRTGYAKGGKIPAKALAARMGKASKKC